MFNVTKKTLRFGDADLTLETGRIARQADGAVLVTYGETVVLCTVVGETTARPGLDFFPLTINYQEKTYAAGRIPGGFIKRETRPSEKETLTSRMIDRPIRPLFPKGFRFETQVLCTVHSFDGVNAPDVAAMIGSSACLAISGIPFQGPVGGCRVGFINDELVLNPNPEQLKDSKLDLFVAGTKDAVTMVESEAEFLSEEQMLDAVMFGFDAFQPVIAMIEELKAEVGKPIREFEEKGVDEALASEIQSKFEGDIKAAYSIADKLERQAAVREAKGKVVEAMVGEDDPADRKSEVSGAFKAVESRVMREAVLATGKRIDGRGLTDVRPIDVQTTIFPRTHGSALFTRGETQGLVTVTLGTGRDEQIVESIHGDWREPFYLNYIFPPYCVGETGRVGAPKRREIGHGKLATRALAAVIPAPEDFPYTVRVVSEITESNGSSSMATVCGGSLAMMDAGVPLKAPVSGIAMGLVKEGDRFAILSDIMGDEDHLGDMDFKVAGSDAGITALQMDIKITGINREIMAVALSQAKEGRTHILGEMKKGLASHREELSMYAPRIISLKIHPDKIRDVIGAGGKVIRSITEETGAQIDINDDGEVKIASTDGESGEKAKQIVLDIVSDVEVGKIYKGKVVRIMDFGAFVNILPKKDGLVHISQLSNERVQKVSDVVKEGEMVTVKVLEIDRQGRVKLTMKNVEG